VTRKTKTLVLLRSPKKLPRDQQRERERKDFLVRPKEEVELF
jgi:hypothetical protein